MGGSPPEINGTKLMVIPVVCAMPFSVMLGLQEPTKSAFISEQPLEPSVKPASATKWARR